MKMMFLQFQARWITVCSNILRLYFQTAKPSQKLIKLVKYIVLVYCPILFDIKWKPEVTNGKIKIHHIYLVALNHEFFRFSSRLQAFVQSSQI